MMEPKPEVELNRREFIQTAGLALGVLCVAPAWRQVNSLAAPAAGAATAEVLYQGTQQGQILQSLDGGQTWQVLVNFGEQCPVEMVASTPGGVVAQLVHQGRPFVLQSADGRTWYTAQYHHAQRGR